MTVRDERRVQQRVHPAISHRCYVNTVSHGEDDCVRTRSDDGDVDSAAADGITGAKHDVGT